MTPQNPYTQLEEKAFWSPAVAKKHFLDINGLWTAKYNIGRKTKIATFGSCFAQHFSRALVARDFTWVNGEEAPQGMNAATAKQFNYGVFSARTGNIYTTSLLLQWVEWALGHREPPEIHWEKDGRIYDPFRPVVEPKGFASVEEMLASRQGTIDGFREAIMTCDLFVFTLGLTESWIDSELMIEYPMCPGTVAGDFDPERHEFVNQDYNMVRRNLDLAIRRIRKAREKGPKFLLTVSPVPLTATNSGNHVLVATMESKSILRAAAAKIAKSKTRVDYFPSYEIISAPAYRGSFFEPNMRSVNLNGVGHVMKTFFEGIGFSEDASKGGKGKGKGKKKKAGGGKTRKKTSSSKVSKDELQCEEELLAAFEAKA